MVAVKVQVPPYDAEMALYGLSDDQAGAARETIAAAALDAARLAAAAHLVSGLADGAGDAASAAAVLTERNTSDPRYALMSAIEKSWALLTLQLVAGVVSDPSPAVRDARDRGATVAEIAATLGITEPAIYKRYSEQVRRRR